MKLAMIALAVLMLTMPLSQGRMTTADLVEVTIQDPDTAYTAPPPGYYYDPATSRWYHFDGVMLTAEEPGFSPPPGAGWAFELQPRETTSAKGFTLVINMKLIGAHTLHYLIEYGFVRNEVARCLDDTRPPPCVEEGDRTSRNFLVGPTVVSTIERNVDVLLAKPNSGTASAWGWLDTTVYDKNTATVRDGPMSW